MLKVDYYNLGEFILSNFGMSSHELSSLIKERYNIDISHDAISTWKLRIREEAAKFASGDTEYIKLLMESELNNLKLLYEATLKIKEKIEKSDEVDPNDFKNFTMLISQLLNAISLNQRRTGEFKSQVKIIKVDPVEILRELKRIYKESNGQIEGNKIIMESPQLIDAIRRASESDG